MNSIKKTADLTGRGVIFENRGTKVCGGRSVQSVLSERRESCDSIGGAEHLTVLLQILFARRSDVFGPAEFGEGGEHPAEDSGVGIFRRKQKQIVF